MSLTVYLQSDEFGREEFERDSLTDALATIERIYQKCRESPPATREIGIVYRPDDTQPTNLS